MIESQITQHRTPKNRRRERILLWAILLIGFVPRLLFPTLSEFKLDEATVARRALAIAYQGDLPIEGVGASVGVANLPLFLYLIAIPLRLWNDPLAAVVFVCILNSAAIWACYAVGAAFLSRRAGQIAAFLFAVSPWAILYGRKIWVQNLPLITLGFIAALLVTFVRRRPEALIWAFAGAAALVGLHLGGLAFLPILALTLVLFRRDVQADPLLAGLGVAALAALPYLGHDALNGWANARGLLAYSGGDTNATLSLDAFHYAVSLTGSAGIEGQAGVYLAHYLDRVPSLWMLNDGMSALVIIAVLYGGYRAFRGAQEQRRTAAVLLLWLCIPVLMQLRVAHPTQPHYFILLYPVQFLLVGQLLADFLAWIEQRASTLHRRVRLLPTTMLGISLLVWGGWQLAVWGNLLVMMVEHPTTGGYGIPLRYLREAERLADVETCGDEVIIVGASNNVAFDGLPAAFDALLFNRPRRFVDDTAIPVPNHASIAYVVGPVPDDGSALQPALELLESHSGFEPGGTARLPDGWTFYSYCRRTNNREDLLDTVTRFPGDIPFANNVIFTGYRIPEEITAGDTVNVEIVWWLRETPPPNSDYHFFAHLVDAAGKRQGQYDGAGYPIQYWQTGDVVVQRFPIATPGDMPAGEYTMHAGMYTYPDNVYVPVVDASGTPIDDGVRLGPIHLTH